MQDLWAAVFRQVQSIMLTLEELFPNAPDGIVELAVVLVCVLFGLGVAAVVTAVVQIASERGRYDGFL